MEAQLQAILARQEATDRALASLQSENHELRSMLSGGIATLPAMAHNMQTIMQELQSQRGQGSAPGGGGSEARLFDNRGLGKPKVFEEEEGKYPVWSRKLVNFIVGNFGESMRAVMNWALESDVEVEKDDWEINYGSGAGEDEIPQIAYKISQLYIVLIEVTDAESNDIVVSAGDGNGLEAWRLLCRRWDPTSGNRKRGCLKAIIAPARVKMDDLSATLTKWLQEIRNYEQRKNSQGKRETISDDVKCAALEQLVPAELENHLILNKHRIKEFREMLDEVKSILEAKTGAKLKPPDIRPHSHSHSHGRGHDPDAMDCSYLQQRGNLVCRRCGKKGHIQKDCWSKAPGGKPGGGAGSGKGGNGNGNGNHSNHDKKPGKCNICGKEGHWARECYHNEKNGGKGGKGGADKGDKGKGKGKGKGKNKGGRGRKGANSLEDAGEEAEEAQCLDLAMMTYNEEPQDLNPFEKSGENWIKLNLDSGSAITGFPRAFRPDGHSGGNGKSYRAATGELVADEGGVKVKAEDELGQLRGVRGRIADIHKPLLAAGDCTKMGQKIWLEDEGGWIIPGGGEVAKKISKLLDDESKKKNHCMLPVYKENGVFNVYLKMSGKSSINTVEEEITKDDKPAAADETKALQKQVRELTARFEAMSSGGKRPPDRA